jgi:hypothetical protein|tara:strand:+ start:959 stop:1537 length:579 start_codon:yes stop_codon:yes gene_type:complete
MKDLIICDNFYSNVDDVREFALKQNFDVEGNYPGHRTKSFLTPSIAKYIGDLIGSEVDMAGLNKDSYCGAYQYTTASDRTWIHCDGWNEWAGVCYLTPEAPPSGGTGIYRHKPTGAYNMPRTATGEKDDKKLDVINSDGQDITKWDLIDQVGNKYNRAVFYRGDLFHASMDYFGKDMHDGRLFQTFFFNTKK